ncbi:MAG: 30S ribosomal protein S2 [Rickettsiaceae bacterium]|nr:MAG: 30S ribosomal protein S2 [Rickettsiaceae bacterium]
MDQSHFFISKRTAQLKKLCKNLILIARRKRYLKLKENKKKIEYARSRFAKKFSSIFYKNSKKLQLKRLLSCVARENFFLKKRKIFLIKTKRQDFKIRNMKYNGEVSLRNMKAFMAIKKKRKLPRRRKAKKIVFYSRFPKELMKDQPLTKFYRMNLELLAINYDLLLGFHAAIGNSYKSWINPAVFSSILAIRNDMVLFDLSMIFIRLKKGLQMLFQISKQRGSILGFVDLNNNYKFSGSGFDHFLRSWLAGYLTNFKYVMKNLIALRTKKFMSLTRRQKKFFQNLVTQREVSIKYYYRFFKISKKFKLGVPKKRKRRIPAIPQFGFSLEDHSIWLNESHKIANNVMCICDSQSFPQQVDFALIANQKSLPLSFFLVKVVTEAILCGKRMDYFSFVGFQNVANYRN